MAAYVKTLKDNEDNIIYPQTKASAVFTESGTTVENELVNIVVQATQPTQQSTGDIWYKVI